MSCFRFLFFTPCLTSGQEVTDRIRSIVAGVAVAVQGVGPTSRLRVGRRAGHRAKNPVELVGPMVVGLSRVTTGRVGAVVLAVRKDCWAAIDRDTLGSCSRAVAAARAAEGAECMLVGFHRGCGSQGWASSIRTNCRCTEAAATATVLAMVTISKGSTSQDTQGNLSARCHDSP